MFAFFLSFKQTSPHAGAPKYKLRLIREAVPSIFKPNLENIPTRRRTGRPMKHHRHENSLRLRKRIVNAAKSSADDEEIIRKVKEEQIRISTNLQHLEDYGPSYYKRSWNKNYQVLKQTKDGEVNPMEWSVEQVVENITKICHNEDIVGRFKEQEIDGTALLDLSKEDLHMLMSIKLGPSIKISHFIEKLRNDVCQRFVVQGTKSVN